MVEDDLFEASVPGALVFEAGVETVSCSDAGEVEAVPPEVAECCAEPHCDT